MKDLRNIFNRFTFFGLMLGSLTTFFVVKQHYSSLYWATSADVRLAARCYRTIAIKLFQVVIPSTDKEAGQDVDILADRMMNALLVKEKIEHKP